MKFFIVFFILAQNAFAERDFASQLGEKIEGCPQGCTCITDINRETKARKKLGEITEKDETGVREKGKRGRTRSK